MDNEKLKMLDKIYNARQYELEEFAKEERKEIQQRLNCITIEEIEKSIGQNIEEETKKQEILEQIYKLVENYEIKMAYYMEKRYKQGFKDAIKLLKECE